MRSNRLQLNTAKTEVIWFASSRRQHQIPQTPLSVGYDTVVPCGVRDFWIYLNLLMWIHVVKTASSCFAVLWQIPSIRRFVSRPTWQTLVASLVLSRLDYGCATLAGRPVTLLDRLQSLLNAATRLIYGRRKYDHVTPQLRELHWLRVPERITFRLATLAYRCQHNMAPHYLVVHQLHWASSVASRQRLRSASTPQFIVPCTSRSTIGDRAFCVTAARAWNTLTPSVQSSESLAIFRRRLKTELFSRSFPD